MEPEQAQSLDGIASPRIADRVPVLFDVFLTVIAVIAAALAIYGSGRAFPRYTLSAAVYPSVVITLTNNDRIAHGLPALTESTLLDQAAQLKADDMATRGYFAHVTPDGRSPLDFLAQVGYRYLDVGENLGLNYADSQAVENGWMMSPEHRANILRKEFTEVGLATSAGTYQGAPATFTVELFGTPYPKSVVPKSSVAPQSYAPTPTALPPQRTSEQKTTIADVVKPAVDMVKPLATGAMSATSTHTVATTTKPESYTLVADNTPPVLLVPSATDSTSATRTSLVRTLLDIYTATVHTLGQIIHLRVQ